MDVSTTLAQRAYGAAKPVTLPNPDHSMIEASRSFAAILEQGETSALSALKGEGDPHTLVQALAQTELAVQTAVAVRDKVVEAYQEILRMPV